MLRPQTAVVLALALGVGLLIHHWPSLAAWTSLFVALQLDQWDTCFFNNRITAAFFLRAEDQGLDRTREVPMGFVTEMDAADYSYENLRIASDNFREPVVVRDWAKHTAALKTWNLEHVRERQGPYDVVVYQNSTMGKDHELNCHREWTKHVEWTRLENFAEALDEISTGTSGKTIVIPPASRVRRDFNASAQAAYMDMMDDLELHRLGGPWTNLGAKYSTLIQFWAAFGIPSGRQGTSWHADICNNFIVQVEGSKNWTFVHPRESKYMRPTMKRGKTAISGADMSIVEENLPHLPKKFVHIRPGDMMYNPDWYWHKVQNNPGFTMAVVARECNFTNSFAANPAFTTMIATNHIRAGILGGDSYALQRLIALLPFSHASVN